MVESVTFASCFTSCFLKISLQIPFCLIFPGNNRCLQHHYCENAAYSNQDPLFVQPERHLQGNQPALSTQQFLLHQWGQFMVALGRVVLEDRTSDVSCSGFGLLSVFCPVGVPGSPARQQRFPRHKDRDRPALGARVLQVSGEGWGSDGLVDSVLILNLQ